MERALKTAVRLERRAARGVIATVVAALAVLRFTDARAQTDTARAGLESPRPDIVIPFTVGPAECPDRSRSYTVTMRIYNVLAQPVAIPVLIEQAGADPVPPGLVGRALSRLALPCGRYAAYWNGRHISTGRRLAPGVYLYDLIIDGQRTTRKVTLGAG